MTAEDDVVDVVDVVDVEEVRPETMKTPDGSEGMRKNPDTLLTAESPDLGLLHTQKHTQIR